MRRMVTLPGLHVTFESDDVWLSEFRLQPSDPKWGRRGATTDSVALIAFPRTTVGIRHEGREEVIADPLSAVAYSPGQPYRRRAVTSVGDDCTVVAVTRRLAAEAAEPFDPKATDAETYRFPFVAVPIGRAAYSAIHHVRHIVSRVSGHSSDAVREELYWVLGNAVAAGYGQPPPAAQPARSATRRAHLEVTATVRERLGRDVGTSDALDELARAACVSPFHLARIFRRTAGQPIHAYRTELRLRASLALIADGVRLADVAHLLGFASHAHLTERFARAYGISPADWRAQLNRHPREMRKHMEASPRGSFLA